jgi:hypothetical protein
VRGKNLNHANGVITPSPRPSPSKVREFPDEDYHGKAAIRFPEETVLCRKEP